jgi:biopolymer transport protein ExbB
MSNSKSGILRSTRRRLGRLACAGVAICCVISTAGILRADETASTRHAAFNAKTLMESGGPIAVVIAAMSIGMLALVFEHLFTLRRNATAPPQLAENVLNLIQQRQFQQAAGECRANGSLLGFVVAAGLAEMDLGYSAVEKAMEDACSQYAARWYRKIDYLSVIGTLSPMLGLLGTVWGMMVAFSEFAAKSNVQVTELAPGISTALVTTLLGLVLAIPAYAAFSYFRNRVDEAVVTCSQVAEHLFADFRRAEAIRERSARGLQAPRGDATEKLRHAFPSIAMEREKSA